MNKLLKFLFKVLVSAFFIAWLIFKVDWQSFWNQIVNVNKVGVILYVVVFSLGILISSYKWQMIAQKRGISLSLRDSYKFYLTGAFVNNFMPSFIGGDAYRAYQAGKKDLKYKESIGVVVADRFFGILGAGMVTGAAFLLNYTEVLSHNVLAIFHIIIFLGTLFLLALLFKVNLRNLAERFAHIKFAGKTLNTMANLAEYVNDRQSLTKIVAWSVIYNLIGISLLNFILFWSLGIEVGVLNYLSVILLISIVSSIPVSINNIGIKEWAYITFFGFFGIGSAPLAAAAILSRFLQMLVSFVALPAYLSSREK